MTRETAVARLIVIGERAVPRLRRVVLDACAPSGARIAALRAVEAIGDTHAADAALQAIRDDDPEVACAGVSAARSFMWGARGATVVEGLTAAALDDQRPEALRVAAVAALADLAPATVAPVREALERDPSAAVRAAAACLDNKSRFSAAAALSEADTDELPDQPDLARLAIARRGASLPLPALHRLVEQTREREARARDQDRPGWLAARAAAHAALARRGSRVALYDIRETLERAKGPLPVELITALAQVGDRSTLDAIAAAYARAVAAGESKGTWWLRHLAEAFRAIVRREKLTRRHATIRRIAGRWTSVAADLF